MSTATAIRLATDRQRSFLGTLLAERQLTADEFNDYAEFIGRNDLSATEASAAITELLARPKIQEVVAQRSGVQPVAQPLEPGVYVLNGTIVKVKKSQAGNPYTLRWVESSGLRLVEGDEQRAHGDWEYAPEIRRSLRPEHRMTVEEAKNFAIRYGQCANCGRTLKAAESVERGIGPVCIKRFAF